MIDYQISINRKFQDNFLYQKLKIDNVGTVRNYYIYFYKFLFPSNINI